MKSRTFLLSVILGFVVGAAGLSGCGSAEMTEVVEGVDIAAEANVPGSTSLHHWKKILSVQAHVKDGQRHVGYLDHITTEEDPEGKFFVKDLKMDVRGFLLPGGKAFAYDPRSPSAETSRDLGNTGFDNGVKKILEVPGEIRYEEVPIQAPPPPAGAQSARS
ncbi:MAG TPA: hypothetical protein VMT52_09045 [Planctomycetota bacterium]|nr:hypothetical protein [Planctomycetota bacterium]